MEDEKNFLFSCEEESRNMILSGTLENSLRKGETQGKWRTDFFWQTSKEGQGLREAPLVANNSVPDDLVL